MYIQNPEQFINQHPIDNLDEVKAKEIYDKLVEDLNYHNYLYYVKSQPVISDYEYDLLFHYLEDLEKKFPQLIRKDSPTQRLTNQIQSELKKAKHIYPLLSLENTYDADEVGEKLDKIIKEIRKQEISEDKPEDYQKIQINGEGKNNSNSGLLSGSWVNAGDSETSSEGQDNSEAISECQKGNDFQNKNFMQSKIDSKNIFGKSPEQSLEISFYIEPKYDGLSIELIYEDGFFKQAITRGDGFIGEDVTENAKTINSMPLKISYKGKLHVRGEVVVKKSIFEKINKEREKQGLETYSNPRNLASGSLRQLDPSITASRQLDVICYEVLNFKEVEGWRNDEEGGKVVNNNILGHSSINSQILSYHSESLDFLEENGFWVFDFKTIIKNREGKNNSNSELLSGFGVNAGDSETSSEGQNNSEINSEGQNNKKSFLNYLASYFNIRHGLKKEEIVEIVKSQEIKDLLDKQDVEFDGLVIKVDNEKYWGILGNTAHHPKWAFAFKYPAKQVSTQLLDVELSVGRTGVITPVAILQPVEIDGVIIKRATLHNFDFIKEKDIHIEDYLWIQRSGEVIPYVDSVIKERRKQEMVEDKNNNLTDLTNGNNKDPETSSGGQEDEKTCKNLIKKYLEKVKQTGIDYTYGYLDYSLKYNLCKQNIIDYGYLVKILEIPYCPVCGGETFHPEGEVALRCINVACPAQIKEKLSYFVSKNGLDIEGLSEKTIELLLEVGLIKDYADVFTLPGKRQQLLALPGFKEKKVENIIKAIEEKKEIPLDVFLQALGIEFIGKKTAKLIVENLELNDQVRNQLTGAGLKDEYIDFGKLIDFLVSKEGEEFLMGINGIGPKVIQSIKKFFHEKHNQQVIEKLLKYIKIKQTSIKKGKFSGELFVVTGSIEGVSRDKIEKWIEENGGEFSNQVTKETTLLLVGEKPGNTKIKKAQEYNIPSYDLYKFLKENGFRFPEKLKTQEGLF